MLNGAVVGSNSLIAAGSVVLEGQQVPEGVLAAGAPAKVKRQLEGNSKTWLDVGADAYMRLTKEYLAQGIGKT